MSTAVMAVCWPLEIPPTAKAVLISIADQANDHGACWPSIAGLVTRTCFGRTAVIEALKWLEEAGLLAIEKTEGRTNRYLVLVDKIKQRAAEPVREADRSGRRTSPGGALVTSPADEPVPVREADQPVRQPDPNRKEPSLGKKRNTGACELVSVRDLVMDGLSEQTAQEFLGFRKRRRAELTPRAWNAIRVEAMNAGMSPEDAAIKCMQRGWTGFEASWLEREARQSSSETAWQRSQRERVAALTGGLASTKAPGAARPIKTMEVIDVSATELGGSDLHEDGRPVRLGLDQAVGGRRSGVGQG